MNIKLEKAKQWVTENKESILVGIGATVLTGIGLLIGYKVIDKKFGCVIEHLSECASNTKELPKFEVGELGDLVTYKNGNVELWLDKINLCDMGKLADNIKEVVSVPDNAKVWALLNVYSETE